VNFLPFFFFFCATCSERKIDRIVKKNCKYQQGFLHPNKIFLQSFCNDSSGFSLQKESSLLLLSLCRHRYENATETSPVPRAGRVLEKRGAQTPSGYQSIRVSSSVTLLIKKIKYTRLWTKSSTGYMIYNPWLSSNSNTRWWYITTRGYLTPGLAIYHPMVIKQSNTWSLYNRGSQFCLNGQITAVKPTRSFRRPSGSLNFFFEMHRTSGSLHQSFSFKYPGPGGFLIRKIFLIPRTDGYGPNKLNTRPHTDGYQCWPVISASSGKMF
jgi:hypothetical protein